MPDTWIDITIKTDVPTIITGLITNIEEDMIEVLSWPKQDMLYFDFEYKGILFYQDKESYITIEKREPPKDYTIKEEPSVDVDTIGITEEDLLAHYNVKEKLDEIIFDADAITFGEDLGRLLRKSMLNKTLTDMVSIHKQMICLMIFLRTSQLHKEAEVLLSTFILLLSDTNN